MKKMMFFMIVLLMAAGFGLWAIECPMDGLYCTLPGTILHNDREEKAPMEDMYIQTSWRLDLVAVGVDQDMDGWLDDLEITYYPAIYERGGIYWTDRDLEMFFSFNDNYGIYVLLITKGTDWWLVPMEFIGR